MGDRTYTSITVPKAFEEIIDLWNTEHGDAVRKEDSNDRTVVYVDEEANYGNIDWLEQLLEDNAVPYDKAWSRGGNFEPGVKAVRSLRTPNEKLAIEILEWDEPQETIDLRYVARLLNAGAFAELVDKVRDRLQQVTADTKLEDAVFFTEHQVLLERLRRDALDRERDECLVTMQNQTFECAGSNNDLIVEAALVVAELIFTRELDKGLLIKVDKFHELVGMMQLRHDIRTLLDSIQRSFSVTEKAADGTWDKCYDYEWMPTFLKAALRFDIDKARMYLDDNFIRIAWEMGLAHKEDREPDFAGLTEAET